MRVKDTISVEERPFVVQSQPLQPLKEASDCLLEVVAVVMVACEQSYQTDNVPVTVNYWQNVTGLCFLPSLIADTFTPFFAIV